MSTRRMLLFTWGLRKHKSLFWDEVVDTDRLSTSEAVLADIFASLTGKTHPSANARQIVRERVEVEARKARIKAREARKARRRKAVHK